MGYKVEYKESVEKDLKRIDISRRKSILDGIENDLAENPQGKGKFLKGKWRGLWRYEIRPYRVIYNIFESEKTILVLRIGHRREVYR